MKLHLPDTNKIWKNFYGSKFKFESIENFIHRDNQMANFPQNYWFDRLLHWNYRRVK